MSTTQLLMLQFTQGNQDKTIIFDASLNEQYAISTQATDHQVERNSNVTDHIRPLPIRINIDAVATNTPIDAIVLAPTKTAAGTVDKKIDVFLPDGTRIEAGSALQFE